LKRVFVVSGASSGIGLAIARSLCSDESVVIGLARTPEKAKGALDEVRAQFGESAFEMRKLDVRNVTDVQKIIGEIAERYRRVDVLVNAAGILTIERSDAVTEESFDAQVDTLFKGTFFLTTAVLPTMVKQNGGIVVNVASIAGLVASPKMAAYAAAKAAVISLTKSWALEYIGQGIRVFCVSPGVVQTNLMDKMMAQMLAQKSPLKRTADPKEVAELVNFLLKDVAVHMTGTNLLAVGGVGL